MNAAKLRQILNAEARESGANDGRISAEQLVERTRDPGHALHRFIWTESEAEAAHQRRLDLARALIRRATIDITVDERVIKVPYMIRDSTLDDDQQGYRDITHVRDERSAAYETLIHELTMLSAARDRLLSLAAVLELEPEARHAMQEMEMFGALVRESRRKPAKPKRK